MNIATGKSISLNELVSLLNQIFGSKSEPIYAPERQGDIKHSRGNIELSNDLLGDYNVTELRDGLVKTARWFMEIWGRSQHCEFFAEVLPLAVRAKPIEKARCNRLSHRPEAI